MRQAWCQQQFKSYAVGPILSLLHSLEVQNQMYSLRQDMKGMKWFWTAFKLPMILSLSSSWHGFWLWDLAIPSPTEQDNHNELVTKRSPGIWLSNRIQKRMWQGKLEEGKTGCNLSTANTGMQENYPEPWDTEQNCCKQKSFPHHFCFWKRKNDFSFQFPRLQKAEGLWLTPHSHVK